MTVASAVPGCAGRRTRGEWPGCGLSFALEGPLGAPPALQVGCGAVAWQSVSPPGCGIDRAVALTGQWHYQAALVDLGNPARSQTSGAAGAAAVLFLTPVDPRGFGPGRGPLPGSAPGGVWPAPHCAASCWV